MNSVGRKLMEVVLMVMVLAWVYSAAVSAQGPIGPLPQVPPSPQIVMVWTEKTLLTNAHSFGYVLNNWIQAGWRQVSQTPANAYDGTIWLTVGKFVIKALNTVPIYIPNQQQIQPSWRRRVA